MRSSTKGRRPQSGSMRAIGCEGDVKVNQLPYRELRGCLRQAGGLRCRDPVAYVRGGLASGATGAAQRAPCHRRGWVHERKPRVEAVLSPLRKRAASVNDATAASARRQARREPRNVLSVVRCVRAKAVRPPPAASGEGPSRPSYCRFRSRFRSCCCSYCRSNRSCRCCCRRSVQAGS